ncbi:hypothetical protein [Blastococcus mobilis]|uniref:Meckel syndrome type 1 protein n=1 Tax=Blastococcus mobilis TaxID=1938746 RepID=A0A238W7H1_9ACTN|nr:hypothetical protein [Blastococcus mobilis]SNR42133.1 hypothetical protein SAMN06272737_106160 [Blastococcus mobilis]
MPLRSVEAASRDDAIAAAREQFGPHARVVGVRRVRSGGVLGFFATERYIAEVAEGALDTTGRPAVPARARADDDALPADFSSPLASAAPARARVTAPARNGAAAYAAEAAARSADDIPPAARAAAAAARAARSVTPAPVATPAPAPAAAQPRTAAPTWAASRPAAPPAEDARVSELVGLLAAQLPEPATPTYSRATFPRASSPRAGAVSRSQASVRDEDDEVRPTVREEDQRVVPDAPSPFTAALARMVAGDQDVRQAVQEALAQPEATRPHDDAEPWPVRSDPVPTAGSSVPSPAARQEEETVGDQVVAPPSTTDRPVEVPQWAAAPEVAAASVSPREEAIADLLRGALAQGHSDEALAGILRKVLAGAAPQTALTEPEIAATAEPVLAVPVEPVFAVPAEPVFAVPAGPEFAVPAQPASPESVLAVPAEHVVAEPLVAVPAEDVVAELPPAAAPSPAPVTTCGPGDQMWGTSSSAPLWGEATSPRAVTTDAPIWAGVTFQESTSASLFPSSPEDQAVTAASAEAPVAHEPVEALVIDAPAIEEPVAEAPVAEPPVAEAQAVEEFVEQHLEESAVAEPAPLLARTASDPAPMMTFDATTVMPPLSLLPPLPSSRGRGRPPVPPAAPRQSASPSARSSAPAAPATTPGAADEQEHAGFLGIDTSSAPLPAPVVDTPEPAAPAPHTRTLATVTRLPVAPLMPTADIAELPEEFDELGAEELRSAAAPADPVAPTVVGQGDVASRLELLGVPADMLGSTFAEDVAERGTYAALTRSLALRLPQAPELPSGAGETVFVVGPGVDALRAARSLAASLRLDPDRVQWATRGDLAGLAPTTSRVTTVDAAIEHRQESVTAGTVTIVAVDAPLRSDTYWMAQMMTVWTPVAVWAVVEATRKPEDLLPWIDRLPRVDALIVQDTDLSADPAAVLRRVNAPVALLDGVQATPHRWASLLCERLESTTT